ARGGVRDQPVRLHPGQPGVDRSGRRRVQAEEPVLQQPDQLVPVLGPVGEELEQVQPQPAVAEYGGHRSYPSSPASAAGRATTLTWPETACAASWPTPEPSRPCAERAPGEPVGRTSAKALVIRPLVAESETSRSASLGTRAVIAPEVVERRIALA